MGILQRLGEWLSFALEPSSRSDRALMAAYDRAAAANRRDHLVDPHTYYCPYCDPRRPIDTLSFENDYACDVHGWVNPIRDDGAIISGDGRPGRPRVIGHIAPKNGPCDVCDAAGSPCVVHQP